MKLKKNKLHASNFGQYEFKYCNLVINFSMSLIYGFHVTLVFLLHKTEKLFQIQLNVLEPSS